MLLTYFLNDFEIVTVAPIITGITLALTFHMRCICIVRSLLLLLLLIIKPVCASSSVGIVSYGLYSGRTKVRFLIRRSNRFFFSPKLSDSLLVPPSPLFIRGQELFPLWTKWPGRKADH
jgi:hypothetical protein